MIELLARVVRERVLEPQSLETVPEPRRVILDPDRAPVDATPSTGDVVPLTTAPQQAVIGSGLLYLRHSVALVVKVQAGSVEVAEQLRGPILVDILARAVALDWTNVPLNPDGDADAPDLEVTRVTWTVDYADQEVGQLAAWFTLTFDIDTEWRL